MVDVSSEEFTGGASAPATDSSGVAAAPKGTGKFVSSEDFLHSSPSLDKETPSADVSGSSALQSFGHHFVANLPGGEDIAAAVEAPFTGRSWSEQKKVFRETGAKQWEEHPWASGAGVAGSVIGQIAALPVDLPEEATAQIAARLPAAAADYAPAIGRTAVGAGYGAVYGGTGGEDLWNTGDAVTGAVTGGVGAAAAPAISKAVGKAARGAAKFAGFGDPSAEAAEKVAGAFKADEPSPVGPSGRAMDPADFVKAKGAGQPVQTVDLGGEHVRELADEAQLNSPAARQALKEAAQERFTSQGSRLNDYVDGTFPGQKLNTAVQKDEIAQAARQQNSSAYRAAYGDPNAQAVWNNDLAELMRDPSVQAAIPKAQKLAASAAVDESLRTGQQVPIPKNPFVQDANGNWGLALDAQGKPTAVPNLQWWDQVNRSLGDQVSKARRAGNMNQARVVGGIQTHLQNALDAEVPQFAQARQSAAGFFGENKLVDSAIKFDKAQDEPTVNSMIQDLVGQPAGPGQRAIQPRSDADREVFARAYAALLKQRASNPAESVDLTKNLLTDTAVKKMQAALNTPSNPTRGNEIEAWLRREQAFNQALRNYGNSKTAQRLAAQAKHGQGHGLVSQILEGFSAPASGAATGAIGAYEGTPHEASWGHTFKNMAYGAAAGAFFGKLAQRRGGVDAKTWEEVARQLSSSDPQVYQNALKRVARRPLFMRALRQALTVGPAMGAGATGPFGQ